MQRAFWTILYMTNINRQCRDTNRRHSTEYTGCMSLSGQVLVPKQEKKTHISYQSWLRHLFRRGKKTFPPPVVSAWSAESCCKHEGLVYIRCIHKAESEDYHNRSTAQAWGTHSVYLVENEWSSSNGTEPWAVKSFPLCYCNAKTQKGD